MSSGNFLAPAEPAWFEWHAGLTHGDYVMARYRVGSSLAGRETALGMAMEQSAATTRIAGHVEPAQLAAWTIRIRAIRPLPAEAPAEVAPYSLHTEVYGKEVGAGRSGEFAEHCSVPAQPVGCAKPTVGCTANAFEIELAVPLRLLAGKPAQLWNILVGELPRLGFLSRFRLTGVDLPADFGPGPAFGIAGIRERLAVPRGPLLCRSMRPAVGLDVATMARLNREVLGGGFHLVKDDELQVFVDATAYASHVAAMVAARDEAMAASGERKGYVANLICEPDELEERWQICRRHGVDGVLVAPFIQGLGTVAHLARRRELPILAHNSLGELFTRHPGWAVDDAVCIDWLRHLGADWFVTPGGFGEAPPSADQRAALAAGAAPRAGLRPLLPILQGGKEPAGLPRYRQAAGGDDFMLIVASWVDRHPDGIAGGAREFRAALRDGLPPLRGDGIAGVPSRDPAGEPPRPCP